MLYVIQPSYAISLLTQQNLDFMDMVMVKCNEVNLSQVILRIQQMYLTYVDIVGKLNSTHGKGPFSFFFGIYASIIAVGTFIVLNDEKSTMTLLPQHLSVLAICMCFVFGLIRICEKCYSTMEQFRHKALIFANFSSKQTPNQMYASRTVINTLRGIPLLKMKAAQTYDMEYSLFLSLIASAIPTCVMIVSLLKEAK